MKLLFIVGLALVVTVTLVAAAAAVFWQRNKNAELEKNYQKKITALQDGQSPQQPQQQQTQAPASVSDLPSVDDQSGQVTEQIALDKIDVDWAKKAVEVTDNCAADSKCFLVGKINNDSQYKGDSFYLEATPTMGGSDMMHYILEKDGDGADIRVYAEDGQGSDNKVVISGINDIPDEIAFPGTDYKLKKYYSPSHLFSELKTKKKLFTDNRLGDFYLTDDGCVVAKLPDGTAIAYDFVIPFIDGESKVPDITFDSGGKNKYEYDYINPSCGAICTYLSQLKDGLTPDSIEVVGKTSNGESIYRLKDPNDKRLEDLYADKNTVAYYTDDYQQQAKSKYSYAEFINLNPYLFWQDPLGRWIRFLNSKLGSAAEMCKPVIYLYPQEKTDLSINLSVNGKLTHTDPLYQGGWRVEASPGGQIKNLDTGKYYDSLLWEGVGLNYPKQDKGWAVKRDDLDNFFSEKLRMLGLNDKEAGDFKAYWLARLDEKPFYRISFLSKEQFGNLASVEFNPIKPAIFIRVMMTAEGLDNYINIPEQLLPNSPQRSGFTAVEWGGALLK